MNSRPLSRVDTESEGFDALTPGHFLVGEPLLTVPDYNFESSNIGSLRRWQLTQRMVQTFWRRWSQEYLSTLVHRYKWADHKPEPNVGDLVLIKEDDLPPARWLLGRVVVKHERGVGPRNNTPVIRRPGNSSQRVLLTFKDVEGSLDKFSGDGDSNVQQWLDDFEEMALLCGWNDVQKIAYAKRLLEGSAKLFVNYEMCAKTWNKLKKSLKDEFEEVVDSLQVHRELGKRKKRSDETYQEYTYKMLQIASQANIETRVVIQYIIEGILDDAVNKAMLYGAKDIKQLKERFYQYETMKREMTKTKTRPVEKKFDKLGRTESHEKRKPGVATSSAKPASRRYFNCGAEDHVSAVCPEKGKGKKCFKCSEFGHIASECQAKSKDVYVVSRPKKEKYQKQVKIRDRKVLALVDTGSD